MDDLNVSLDENSSVAKYEQVYNWLRSMIDTNKFSEDARLPTEEELAKKFGINRMTARKAVQALADEGIVVRIRRKGTFISRSYADRGNFYYDLNKIISFESMIKAKNMRSSYRVCENRVVEASPQVIEELGLPQNSMVIKLYRIISANNEPMFLEKSYFPYPRFKMLLDKDLNKPVLLTTVMEYLGKDLACASQVLIAGLLDNSEKIDLQYDRSKETPCMRQQNIICDEKKQPVFAFHATFPGDKFRFIVSSDGYKSEIV